MPLPGAVLAGPAFSGSTANADSAQTVVNNPAGMMRIKQPSVYENPMIFYARSESEGTEIFYTLKEAKTLIEK